jgi:hypothetical protein
MSSLSWALLPERSTGLLHSIAVLEHHFVPQAKVLRIETAPAGAGWCRRAGAVGCRSARVTEQAASPPNVTNATLFLLGQQMDLAIRRQVEV